MGGAPRYWSLGSESAAGAAHRTLTEYDYETGAYLRGSLDKDFFTATGRRPFGICCENEDCRYVVEVLSGLIAKGGS